MRHFRLALIAIALALVSLVLLAGCSAAPSSSTTPTGGTGAAPSAVSVSLKNFAIDPSDITVAVGGTVTFTNNDTVQHNIAGDNWSSGPMAAGATFPHTFTTAGSFPIHCLIHPSMTANVTVK
jgi:plastocyanin